MQDDIDIRDAATFWVKHRQKIYSIIILVVGLLGGNVDRIGNLFITPDNEKECIEIRLDNVEKYIKNHEQSHKELLEALKILRVNVGKFENQIKRS